MRDIVLTGLPRSGTTLTCELLNRMPDTVALDEPMDFWSFSGRAPSADPGASRGLLSVGDVPDHVRRFCRQARRSVRERGTVITKHVGGRVLGQKVSDNRFAPGGRLGLAERGEIPVDKDLSDDFTLVVKHVAGFTASLTSLAAEFPAYAVVRNPLAVLSSWQTVDMPIRDGHVVYGEMLDPDLARRLASTPDRVDRQLHLLSWFFSAFAAVLAPSSIVRYEDLVTDPGRTLEPLVGAPVDLDVTLRSRDRNRAVYGRNAELADRLLSVGGPWEDLYGPESVEALLDEPS